MRCSSWTAHANALNVLNVLCACHSPSIFFHVVPPSHDGSLFIDSRQMNIGTVVEIVATLPEG
jgi:hypothetical protein